MSVLIKGMQIPKTCLECIKSGFRTAIHCAEWSEISAGLREHTRSLSCPLEEVPTPHGNLIDEEYLKEHIIACSTNGRPLHTMELSELLEAIDDVPTVIEAEE